MEELKAEKEKELVETRGEIEPKYFTDRKDIPQSMKALGNMTKS